MAVAVTTNVDDLFRQKSLHEIHDVLKQTRAQVEAKKQELRELVGDHYRSVLESSDHIRAMSECAAKVSAGADRIEELIASMRELAASPPTAASSARAVSRPPEEDSDYRVGVRVMALLEMPETVRGHLGTHEFVRAARLALLDAAALQDEVEELLRTGGPELEPSGFDVAALVRQQATAFRGIPRQIAASCLDAFSAAGLEPTSAAESFVVHLLLNTSAQPFPLLRTFLDRRSEALRCLLDVAPGGGAAPEAGTSCGARLAAAAMTFEGTVVLAGGICRGPAGGEPAWLKEALAAVVENGPNCSAAEERAAIEGRKLDTVGIGLLRRRAEALSSLLRQISTGPASLAAELARLGQPLLQEWAPEDGGASPVAIAAAARSLSARFGRVVATAPSGELSSCKALGEVLRLCTEKVLSYRSVLAKGSAEDWRSLWKGACAQFCPGRLALSDALTVLTATVEAACAEVVRERAAGLQLELAAGAEETEEALAQESGDAGGGAEAAAASGSKNEAQQREEILEIQRRSRLLVAAFDERLGEIIADLGHISQGGGEPPTAIVAALLGALHENLLAACDRVRLPPARPLWPSGGNGEQGSGASARPRATWAAQRQAARAAIAFDALLSAATEPDGGEGAGPSQLHGLLRTAEASGDQGLASQAQALREALRERSNAAYCAWARLAVEPEAGAATLEAFKRLADDEVPPACGWGSAKFAQGQSADGQGGAAKAVPVPVQASPFIFERLTLGARRALEVSSSVGALPHGLVMALKTALSESFAAAYEAEVPELERLKRSGMHHLLQWLFDLSFLRIALSAGPAPGAAAAAATQPAAARSAPAGGAAYEALMAVLERAEATALSDPVDRLLYQEVLKTSVKGHVAGVRILLAPFFLHNPLYGFLFQSQPGAAERQNPVGNVAGKEGDGFELQATFVPPLRPAAPRFLLLPVANASALAHASSSELDARLGLSADSAQRAAARGGAASAAGATGSGAVSSLMQQVGLGSLGLGKSWAPLGSNWPSGWGGGGAAGMRPPEAV